MKPFTVKSLDQIETYEQFLGLILLHPGMEIAKEVHESEACTEKMNRYMRQAESKLLAISKTEFNRKAKTYKEAQELIKIFIETTSHHYALQETKVLSNGSETPNSLIPGIYPQIASTLLPIISNFFENNKSEQPQQREISDKVLTAIKAAIRDPSKRSPEETNQEFFNQVFNPLKEACEDLNSILELSAPDVPANVLTPPPTPVRWASVPIIRSTTSTSPNPESRIPNPENNSQKHSP